MEKQKEIEETLLYFLNEKLERITCSNSREKEGLRKLVLRPVLLKGELKFQAEEFTDKQAFHRNLTKEEAVSYVMEQTERLYRNVEAVSKLGSFNLLIGKKGTVTLKVKKKAIDISRCGQSMIPTHNRSKHYVLPEGVPVPFLVELGVMTPEGLVVKSKYDKFRQINRFLEFIEDVLPHLDKSRETTIIDFGCGKSYLTFAMYYYLKEVKGYPIRVAGLDLKKDVIALCSRLSEKFGFDHLHFYQGDIAGFEGVDHVDMVVTLHACDTATDYAMAKAVKWGAGVILSVPCCQHELNRQIESELLEPVLNYGILKERISALLTDGIRAELLKQEGYKTQVLEFIDMEHTPKNIMIRAVKQSGGQKEKPAKMNPELKHMMEALHVTPTLAELLK